MDKRQLAGCVLLKDNKILLLHRIKTDWYELPGGKIDGDETPEETAKRELEEELLCTITIVKKLGAKDFTDNGYVMGYTWFLATILDDQVPEIGEPDKFDKYEYFDLSELSNINLSPNMENLLKEINEKRIILA